MNTKETVMLLWVGEAKHINSSASPPGGVLQGILGEDVSPGSPNTDPQFQTNKKVIFHTGIQTWMWSQNATLHVYMKQKLCHHC